MNDLITIIASQLSPGDEIHSDSFGRAVVREIEYVDGLLPGCYESTGTYLRIKLNIGQITMLPNDEVDFYRS